jgi:hypothetical protein
VKQKSLENLLISVPSPLGVTHQALLHQVREGSNQEYTALREGEILQQGVKKIAELAKEASLYVDDSRALPVQRGESCREVLITSFLPLVHCCLFLFFGMSLWSMSQLMQTQSEREKLVELISSWAASSVVKALQLLHSVFPHI